jgi:serine/threonine-protein kinase
MDMHDTPYLGMVPSLLTTTKPTSGMQPVAIFDEIPAGTPAGPFVSDAPIARGGFGTVYRAHHRRIDRKVAIKVMHPELAASGEAHDRFENEALLATLCRHHNVVGVEDLGQLEGQRAFLTMELIEGIDVESYLRRVGRLRLAEVIRILEHLASALDHVHACGVVHRDIKAANLMLEMDASGRVVLLDFGVAKQVTQRSRSLTRVNHVIGTPAYMAPEQVRGEDVDHRTDLYALGALTYELLTGRPPYGESNTFVTQHLHVHAQPPRVSAHADLPASLDDVIIRALAKDPADRHASATELVEALAGASRSRPRTPTGDRRDQGVAIQVDLGAADWRCRSMVRHLDRARTHAERWLEAHGYVIAGRDAHSVLGTRRIAGRGQIAAQLRRAIDDGRALLTSLHRRSAPEAPPPIIRVHSDEVVFFGPRPVAGPLLDPARWEDGQPSSGLAVTRSTLDGAMPAPARRKRITR